MDQVTTHSQMGFRLASAAVVWCENKTKNALSSNAHFGLPFASGGVSNASGPNILTTISDTHSRNSGVSEQPADCLHGGAIYKAHQQPQHIHRRWRGVVVKRARSHGPMRVLVIVYWRRRTGSSQAISPHIITLCSLLFCYEIKEFLIARKDFAWQKIVLSQ